MVMEPTHYDEGIRDIVLLDVPDLVEAPISYLMCRQGST